MKNILQTIDWPQLISTLWSLIILPILTYAASHLQAFLKAKKLDKYGDILYKNVLSAVKDVQESSVKNIKGTSEWTAKKQKEVQELARIKAIQALSNSAYQILKTANTDFDAWLDSLIVTALYDLKNKKS